MVKRIFITSVFLIAVVNLIAIHPTDSTDKKSQIKTGWTFGAVPAIAYDSDIGFKYGGLINFFNYGDGSMYPEYKHSIYLEWSRTTKGSGINQITYDSKYLIPNVRVSGEISYLTEKALDFYGFNGYKSLYDASFEDDTDPDNYLSRVFYRQERDLLRLRADFQGKLINENLQWIAGIVYNNVQIDTVDINKLNEGKSTEDRLPPVDGGLYGLYGEWNILPSESFDGGTSTFIKAGFEYDTRDNEPNPMHGLWSGITLFIDPGFWSEGNAYGRYAITYRQYFTLVSDRLSFAYRLVYQGKLFGSIPAYMLPFMLTSGRYTDKDGFGGAKTIRGILRNRVVGDDMALGNFEFRWKFLRTVVFKQNIYLALSAFTDMGLVTKDYEINTDNVPQEYIDEGYFTNNEGIHQSVGAGFRIALNENFIVAADYGIALNKKDGDSGLYINLNWLF